MIAVTNLICICWGIVIYSALKCYNISSSEGTFSLLLAQILFTPSPKKSLFADIQKWLCAEVRSYFGLSFPRDNSVNFKDWMNEEWHLPFSIFFTFTGNWGRREQISNCLCDQIPFFHWCLSPGSLNSPFDLFLSTRHWWRVYWQRPSVEQCCK